MLCTKSSSLSIFSTSNGQVVSTTQLSGNERNNIFQATETKGLLKIKASLAENLLQRKELERQLAKYKLTHPYSTYSYKYR